ncbi:MAG: hypothetical protein STSR0008_09650 [Ignavibacterium sp.]
MKVLNYSIIFFILIQLGIYAMDENRIVRLKVTDDPTITFRIAFKVGSQNDPIGKEGLAYLTSRMLSESGTQKFTYEQILEKLYPLATSYSADATTEITVFYGRVHKDNLKEFYNLFIEQLLEPGFRQEDFERLKDEQLTYLTTILKYSSDEELGKAVLYNNIFEGTPYGHILQGTISSIQNITLDDVKNFYKEYFNRNNFIIGIGGNFDENLVIELWNDLQKLSDGKQTEKVKINPRKIDGLNVTIVEKNAPATAISMGYPINILRGQKEWYALAIANSWLGEHRNSSSHLYQVIREARGLNYGDYSYIENFPNGGSYQMPPVNVPRLNQIFEIWIRPVPNETRHFVLRAALRELQILVENGLTKEQFELTRNFLKKYILNYATTTSRKLGYAIDDKYYGINGNHLELFKKYLNEITLNDVNSAIKKNLQYENIEIVFVTNNANDLNERLINNVSSPINYTSPKPNSILEEDKVISEYKLNIQKDKVKIKQLEELF